MNNKTFKNTILILTIATAIWLFIVFFILATYSLFNTNKPANYTPVPTKTEKIKYIPLEVMK